MTVTSARYGVCDGAAVPVLAEHLGAGMQWLANRGYTWDPSHPPLARVMAALTVYADGGGKASAHGAPVAGLDNVMRLFAAFAPLFAASRSRLVGYGCINGLPGFVTIERGDILQTTALEIEDGRIVAVYVVRNPDKLKRVRL